MEGERFGPRSHEDGSWGVWDHAANGWRGVSGMTQVQAADQAWDMAIDLQLREYGYKHPDAWRPREPASSVEVLIDGRWWAGSLSEWRRHPDGTWWGRATAEWHGDSARWLAATALRERTP